MKDISSITTINPIFKREKVELIPKILMPIKSKYWNLIQSGKKTIEVRKRIPADKNLFCFYLAETGTGCVVGEIWNNYTEPIELTSSISNIDLQRTCLSLSELKRYMGKSMGVWLIPIYRFFVYSEPIPIDKFCGLKRIPQGYCWIGDFYDR